MTPLKCLRQLLAAQACASQPFRIMRCGLPKEVPFCVPDDRNVEGNLLDLLVQAVDRGRLAIFDLIAIGRGRGAMPVDPLHHRVRVGNFISLG